MWRAGRRQTARATLAVAQIVRRVVGRLPPYGVLKLTLSGDLPEQETEPRLFGFLRRSSDDYTSLLSMLRWARDDAQIRGVLIRCEDLRVGWAKAQGLHRAVLALRHAGKQVWIHLTHAGVREYLIASAADRIVLTPAGTLDVTGLSSEVTFFFGALEKLGIEAEVIQMGRYKSMGETFTRRDMSAAHREMIEALVDDLYGQLVDAIAAGRQLTSESVRGLLDRGPFLGHDAVTQRLVDTLAYEDQAEADLRRACDGAMVIEFSDYRVRRGREMRAALLRSRRDSIALVHLSGTVKSGESVAGPEGASAFGAVTIARELKTLRDRSDIKAVVLRVDSPGGSGLASDLIWREVARTREQKPVVVSFGDVAASGGYYIGVAGAPLMCEAGTLTGSIGVVAGKANLRGLYDRLGITKEIISRGQHAAMHSAYVPLSDDDRTLLSAQAGVFYRDFVAKVASGRQLSEAAVDEIAQGRVWTGRQAWARGLVDRLGGVEDALNEAKRLIGVATDEIVAVERFPKPRRLWKLSLDLNRPQAQLGEVLNRVATLRFLGSERLWAILPLQIRFF
ncbi:MAG TPA: signal peptide peptidase SppA [Candidatus Kryptonia bacterium]|nr:signal peptide peptidase SppA [Candidatus Kryptonia bacterium]